MSFFLTSLSILPICVYFILVDIDVCLYYLTFVYWCSCECFNPVRVVSIVYLCRTIAEQANVTLLILNRL